MPAKEVRHDLSDRPDRPPDQTDPAHPAESPEVAGVRRLLAEARHEEPMPDDVAARMSRVLTGLGDETRAAATPPLAPVVQISARRRRNAAALLVAAAAIVVGGVTLAPHLQLPSSNSGAENAPGGSAAGFDTHSRGASKGSQPRAAEGSSGSTTIRSGRLVVRPRHFAADARQGLALLQHPVAGTTRSAPRCAGVPRGTTSVPAEYRQAPAALVYGPAQGSARAVDLYVCGSPRPVRSTTLSGP